MNTLGIHRSTLVGTGLAAVATLLLCATQFSWSHAWESDNLARTSLTFAAITSFAILPYGSLARFLVSLRLHPGPQLVAFVLVAGTGLIAFGWLCLRGNTGGWAFLVVPFLQMVEVLVLGWLWRAILLIRQAS